MEHAKVPEGRAFQRWLAHWLRFHPCPRVRFCSAYYAGQGWNKRATLRRALLERTEDCSENPLVRGMCLEHLSGFGEWSTSKERLRRERVVLQCLTDSDANVRFWACFAATGCDLRSVGPILESLVGDSHLSDLGWSVGHEATQALKSLRGETGAWEDDPPLQPSPYAPL